MAKSTEEIVLVIRRVNEIFGRQLEAKEIAMLIDTAGKLDVSPKRFFDFVSLTAQGKTFQDAANMVNEEE